MIGAGSGGVRASRYASSLGLNGEENIIPSKLMDEQTTVYDIVYKPLKTDLINSAKEKNCKIITLRIHNFNAFKIGFIGA